MVLAKLGEAGRAGEAGKAGDAVKAGEEGAGVEGRGGGGSSCTGF